MLPRVFHAPSRFHPAYSLVGRWLRRRTGDRRYAEALHILLLTGLALGLLLLHYVSWTLLHETFSASPWAVRTYWLGQLGLVGTVLATCVIGFRPALTVTCTADTLQLAQGHRTLTVPHNAIASIQRISARRFHRHERRYAATRVFIGVLCDEVVLLRRSDGGPVAIALASSDLGALQDHVETARTSTRLEEAVA